MALRLTPLTEHYCRLLAPRVSEGDRQDCVVHDYDPEAALLAGLNGGPCCAVLDGLEVIGAFGWTYEGTIWSLWAELSPEQVKWIMRYTAEMVRQIMRDAKRPLMNAVWEGNRHTISWLKRSHCFDFLDTTLEYQDKVFLPFFVKPLGELEHV